MGWAILCNGCTPWADHDLDHIGHTYHVDNTDHMDHIVHTDDVDHVPVVVRCCAGSVDI